MTEPAAAKAADKASPADILAKLAKVLAAWPGSDDGAAAPAETAPSGAKPPDTAVEASDMATRARAKYDSLIRWMLGIFGAIGILIFGSLAFTDLHGVSWRVAAPGLAMAGIGIAVVIAAATTGLEPHLASLGEIAEWFASLGTAKPWDDPRKRAMRTLEASLSAGDAQAHLGPGIATVAQLIRRIGDLERELLQGEVGWNGGELQPKDDVPTEPPGSADASVTGSSVYRSTKNTRDAADFASFTKSLTDLMTALAALPADKPLPAAVREKLAALVVELAETTTRRARTVAAATNEEDALYATQRSLLDTYMSHRSLVLQEAAVAMLRGTFRWVRLLLVTGALLTLAGGITYAAALSDRATDSATPSENSSDAPRSEVVLTIKRNTDTWKKLKGCQPKNQGDITGLHADLVSSDDADAARNGPFTAIIIDRRCARTVDVPDGDGTYKPAV